MRTLRNRPGICPRRARRGERRRGPRPPHLARLDSRGRRYRDYRRVRDRGPRAPAHARLGMGRGSHGGDAGAALRHWLAALADDAVQLRMLLPPMTRFLRGLTLALLAPAPLAAQQSGFTIEQVMSAPFPDELTAAPTGGAVAWVFNTRGARNIWVAAPPEYAGRAVTAYADDDGQEVGGLRWTPDTRAIVFVRGGGPNEKGDYPNPHSLVAGVEQAVWVVPVAGGNARRIGEGHAPAVSPKGDRVALLRRGQIWWASLADTAPAEQLIHARGTARSLRWSPDGSKLAFVSDRGDHAFIAIYAVPVDGGRATLLTPGGFEVEHVTMSPDGATIVFSSNQDDIERRHIWKVPVAGGPPTALTRGTDLEWTPVMTGDGRGVALIRAGTRTPPRPVILLGTGAPRDLAPGAIPVDFPEAGLVDPQPVLFPAADGMTIHGQLFLPRGIKPGDRRPAVIFFHGGSRRQMLLGWHYFYYYRNAYALNQYLASRGDVVLSVNYRSGIAYGMEFREALHYGAQGASEFNDVLGAGRYLRGRPDVDPKRIGLWGGSYGGFLTAMGLARASDLFAAGVDLHGVHGWNIEIQNWVPTYDPAQQAEAAKLAS